MKKSILNIGKALNKKEQKRINGGSLGGDDCGFSTSDQCWLTCLTYCSGCFAGGWECVETNLSFD